MMLRTLGLTLSVFFFFSAAVAAQTSRPGEEEAITYRKPTWAWVENGVAQLQNQQLDLAIENLNKAVERYPGFAMVWAQRGSAYRQQGDVDQGVRDLTKAVEIDAKDAWAWAERGEAYRQQGKFDQAIQDLTKAVEIDTKDATAWAWRGRTYRQKKEFDQAIEDLSKAVEIDPYYVWAWSLRGEAHRQQGELDLAIEDLSKAVEINPQNAGAWSLRGEAYRQQGEFEQAIEDLTKAVELDTRNAWAWAERGEAYRQLGKVDQAIEDLSKAVDIDPEDTWAWMRLAWIEGHRRNKSAVDYFQSAIDAVGYQGKNATFAVIQGHLVARLLGDDERAGRFLHEARGKLKDEWPLPIVRYLEGELSADELRSMAKDNGQETEVRCYLALDQLSRGNVEAARLDLQWVVADGKKTSDEYLIAVSELERLEETSKEPAAKQPVTQTK